MRTIAVTGNETMRIGRVGENRAVQVVWPGLLEKWRELYGEGIVQLAVRRPKDTAPYPVVCEVRENDVTWTVQAADTARHGIGECELTYLVGEKVAKSQTWATEIRRSLTEDEMVEPPEDPARAWFVSVQEQIGNLDELTTEAKDNLVAAINEVEKSGGGKSVQPDWNQNDDTQPDYVKNRPFYTGDLVETVLVEESTAPFSESNGLYTAQVPSTFEATVGEAYKVHWDGTVYECTCMAFQGVSVLGNLSIPGAGSDTGEPFVVAVSPNQGTEIYTADTSDSHTFSIGKTVVPVVKIDKKYLVQPDWNQSDENAADFVKNRPFYANSLVSVRKPGSSKEFWYKVSDAVPTGEHSVGAPCSIVADGKKTNGEIILSTDDYYAATGARVVVVLKDNVKIEGITFPKKGTYFAYALGIPLVTGFALGADADSEITWDGRTEKELKKLDAKYLPDTVATKSAVEAAQAVANSAQAVANSAQAAANSSKEALNSVISSAVTFTFDKQTSGRDTFVFNAFNYYKISDFNPAPEDVISFKGTRGNGGDYSKIKIGNNCVGYGLFIVVADAGNCSLPVTETVTYSFTAPSAGLYACHGGDNLSTTAGNGAFTLRGTSGSFPINGLLLKSSTSGSDKQFRITVNDSGRLTATEVV